MTPEETKRRQVQVILALAVPAVIVGFITALILFNK